MAFRMSPNIAVRTTDDSAAAEFYSHVLGFPVRSDANGVVDLDADPVNLFVIADDEVEGPVLELFVDDLEAAREQLVASGCRVIRWGGKGQDCYIRDPFGVTFNLWEE
ncbi:MAG: hypothetical protein KJO17_08490 [Acidimicrobiia bacterium]|nr:hypothetical protein [Acidimicrobiia bacterium]